MLRNLLLLVFAVDSSCADYSSLLQLPMRKQRLQTHTEIGDVSAGQLLGEVKDLAMRAEKSRQDPVRQCQGGWQSGDGTGGSERSIGSMDRDACAAAVRNQCQDANGATYMSDSQECFCEVGQAGVDASAAERVNCLFFQDGTTDSDMEVAVHSLIVLVETIVSSMRREHAEADEVVAQSFATLHTALEHTNTHTAISVEGLQQERIQREIASAECTAELDRWTQTHSTSLLEMNNKQHATTPSKISHALLQAPLQQVPSGACPAWELHVQSLAACSQASQCQSDTEAFFNAAHVWEGILANGGWEEIVRMREECNEATTQRDHFRALCPELEEHALAAAQAHETALATHLEFCAWYATTLEHYLAIVEQTTLSLEQRQREYDILQQVGCYVDLITSATGSGQLADGQCASASFDGRGAEEFPFTFPELPADPECLSQQSHDASPPSPWTLVLQYGEGRYSTTTEAVGVPNADATGFAKLSDEAINALPSGGGADFDYYMLTSNPLDGETEGSTTTWDSMFLRTASVGGFNDVDNKMGIVPDGASWGVCNAASLYECTEWSTQTHNRFDTSETTGDNCNRWFTGWNGVKCYAYGEAGHITIHERCFSRGVGCTEGSRIRINVKMYKLTA